MPFDKTKQNDGAAARTPPVHAGRGQPFGSLAARLRLVPLFDDGCTRDPSGLLDEIPGIANLYKTRGERMMESS
jgi:hypothetical protein